MANISTPPLLAPDFDPNLTRIEVPEPRKSAVQAVDPEFVEAYQQAASRVKIGVTGELSRVYDFDRDELVDGGEDAFAIEPLTEAQILKIQHEDGLLEVIDQVLSTDPPPPPPASRPPKSKPRK